MENVAANSEDDDEDDDDCVEDKDFYNFYHSYISIRTSSYLST